MQDKTLTKALQALDNDSAKRATRQRYLDGTQPLAFIAPEARKALGERFTRMTVDVPNLAVQAITERLRVTGFAGAQADLVWADWKRLDLDQLAPIAHREALALGDAYVIVWGAGTTPVATIESATQVAVLRDPATRQVTAAVKRWEDDKGTRAVLFTPEKITQLTSPSKGATLDFTTSKVIHNPLGVVPVVPLRNSNSILGNSSSIIDPLMAPVDALAKLLTDLLVTSETGARPRRWATGVELVEDPVLDAEGNVVMDEDGQPMVTVSSPIRESDRMMVVEAAEAKVGQLPGADLGNYADAVRVLQEQISAVSGLPQHYLGISSANPASADALRASEASLVARCESYQRQFGRAWEAVARLMVAIRTSAPVDAVELAVQWADAGTRSIAQEADAVVKLYSAGLLPASYALKRLGYSDDEVAAIRAARRAEALDQSGSNLSALLPADGAA